MLEPVQAAFSAGAGAAGFSAGGAGRFPEQPGSPEQPASSRAVAAGAAPQPGRTSGGRVAAGRVGRSGWCGRCTDAAARSGRGTAVAAGRRCRKEHRSSGAAVTAGAVATEQRSRGRTARSTAARGTAAVAATTVMTAASLGVGGRKLIVTKGRNSENSNLTQHGCHSSISSEMWESHMGASELAISTRRSLSDKRLEKLRRLCQSWRFCGLH